MEITLKKQSAYQWNGLEASAQPTIALPVPRAEEIQQ